MVSFNILFNIKKHFIDQEMAVKKFKRFKNIVAEELSDRRYHQRVVPGKSKYHRESSNNCRDFWKESEDFETFEDMEDFWYSHNTDCE